MSKSLPGGAATFKELLSRCTGNFIPTSLDDFVGDHANERGSGARCIARKIEQIVRHAKANDCDPLKILLNGRPGLGKTALSLYFQRLIGCDKWSTTKLNGTQVKLEVVEQLATQMHYKGLFGDYRLIHIDEADEIPRVAQVRFLSLLDDLPSGAAVICTSNCKISDFEERFQTRFQVFDILPPKNEELELLVNRYVGDLNTTRQIVLGAGGNVRSALLDAKGVLQD